MVSQIKSCFEPATYSSLKGELRMLITWWIMLVVSGSIYTAIKVATN